MIEEDIPDIVETLRECAEDSRESEGDYYADQFSTDASVFDDAADAIEKLRDDVARLRLTDAEREAAEWAIGACEREQSTAYDAADRGYKLPDTREWAAKHGGRAATLRGLLERMK